jgi:hypothetical protein
MAFKEVYDCEILSSEIVRRPALCDCSLKEYSDKGLKGRLWGEMGRAKMEMRGIMRKAKSMVFQSPYAQCFTATTLYHRHMVIICGTKTHKKSQIFQIKEL